MESKLAKLLIEHSLALGAKDVLLVDYQKHALPVLSAIKEIAKGRFGILAFPRSKTTRLSDLEVLDTCIDDATAYLRIGGGRYSLAIGEDVEQLQRKEGEIMLKRCALKWVSTQYPSTEMANALNLSLGELRDLYFRCCFVDYGEQRNIQEQIAGRFQGGEVRIVSPDTNIVFETVGNPHFCDGKVNIPDGELFYEINPSKTQGEISFTIPTMFGLNKFGRIKLKFENGRVIDYQTDNLDGLRRLLNTDNASTYLGEFGIGTNPHARVVGNSFYDEKVQGTFHLALGAMSSEMQSRLHMDLVKDATGCKIINNGREVKLF